MLWAILVLVLILWLLGFAFHVAGAFIHLLLIVAAVIFVIELITTARAGRGPTV